jgi:hypothetical protein
MIMTYLKEYLETLPGGEGAHQEMLDEMRATEYKWVEDNNQQVLLGRLMGGIVQRRLGVEVRRQIEKRVMENRSTLDKRIGLAMRMK